MFWAALFVSQTLKPIQVSFNCRMDNPTVVLPQWWWKECNLYNVFGKLFGYFCQSQICNWWIALLGMYPTEMHTMFVKQLYKNVHSFQVVVIKVSGSIFHVCHWQLPRPLCLSPQAWTSQYKSPGAHPLAQVGSSNCTNSSPWKREPSPWTSLSSPQSCPMKMKTSHISPFA